MFDAKTYASIAGLLKTTPEILKAAAEAKEEVTVKVKRKNAAGAEEDVEIDKAVAGLQVFTPEELTARDTNTKEAGKSGYITAGKEIAIKELKEKTGIEFSGKDPEKFLAEYKTHVLKEAKVNPDARVTELETQLNLVKTTSSGHEAKVKDLERQISEAVMDREILSNMPARNPDISDNDYLLMIRSRVKAETVDGKTMFKDASGNVLRNKQDASPLDLKTVVGDMFAANKGWSAPAAGGTGKDGRGGGNSGGGTGGAGGGSGDTPISYSQAVKAWQGSGKNIQSGEFATYLGTLQKDNKDFKMDLENVVNEVPAD
jgi:hypothetical protein